VSDSTRRIGLLRWTTCATPAYLERHGVPLHPTDIERDGHVVVGYFSALSNRTVPLRFAKDGEVIEIEPRKGMRVMRTRQQRSRGSGWCRR
jgi:hypothetical protein